MCFTWLRPYWWIEVPGNNILVLRTRKNRLDFDSTLDVLLMQPGWNQNSDLYGLKRIQKPEVQSFTYTKAQIIKTLKLMLRSWRQFKPWLYLVLFFVQFEPTFCSKKSEKPCFDECFGLFLKTYTWLLPYLYGPFTSHQNTT